MEKSLDQKIARILADGSCRDFILADAKDADMAFGIASPGKSPEHHAHEGRFRSLAEYRELIRQNVKQGLVDIMLMSASTNEKLAIEEKLFADSHVTPAARANDTSDVHVITGSSYALKPSRPFRTATIDHIMCGQVSCPPAQPFTGADLGLYSMTFNNDLKRDLASLEAYKDFRLEAERKGFRHFLELFNPNACEGHCPPRELMGRFINDHITRLLAGVTRKGRPIFLKIPYNGPEAMEELASYDRTLIPGILGGSAGTTFDAFHQLWEAKKYGARAALYGRMINGSENQLLFIQHLRWIADGQIDSSAEAVKSYHAGLEKLGIQPYRSLQDDLVATLRATSYSSSKKSGPVAVDGSKPASPATHKPAASNASRTQDASPDFSKMSPAEKVAWNLNRWKQLLD